MRFLEDAVKHSIKKPGEVDLYISSAPHIHITTLYDVIKHIEPLDQTHFKCSLGQAHPEQPVPGYFKCVTFFFRQDDFDTVIGSKGSNGSNMDSMISTVFKANIQNGKYEVYVSSDKYFHTKWCAYVAESDSHVKTLFTSANLTTDHLKPLRYGEKIIPNSVVTDRMQKGIFENGVLSPQLARCSHWCSIVKWDSQSEVFKPEYKASEHPNSGQEQLERSVDIPQNVSSRLIYQKVVAFIETAKTHLKDKPSGVNHYIYIVSPFIIKTLGNDSSIIDKLCSICCDRAASSDQAVLTTKIVHFHDGFSSKSINMKLEQIGSKVRTFLADNKFHCKFIAWVRSDENEVRILQTSANFNSENMTISPIETRGSYSNLEWIVEHTITKDIWDEKIKQRIGFE